MQKAMLVAGGVGAAVVGATAIALVATGEGRKEVEAATPAPPQAQASRPAAEPMHLLPPNSGGEPAPMAEWQTRAEEWLDRLPPEQREQVRQRMEEGRARWIARWDTDGDGELNEQEQAEMDRQREEFRQRQIDSARRRIEDVFGGELDLSDEEVLAVSWMVAAQMRSQISIDRAEIRAEADADGDGELSRGEIRRARELAGERMRQQMAELTQQYAGRFDLDESGSLDAFERREASELLRAQIQHQRAMARLDSSRTGSLESHDAIEYMARFGAGDPRADLNGDGRVGVDDLDLFNNLMADPTPPMEGFGGDFMMRGFSAWGDRDGRMVIRRGFGDGDGGRRGGDWQGRDRQVRDRRGDGDSGAR